MIGEMIIGEDRIGEGVGGISPIPSTFQYFKLGKYDLTGHVIVPIDIKGFEKSLKELSSPGLIRTRLTDQGAKPLEYGFNAIFSTEAEADAFRKVVNPTSEDINFYPGIEDWYHVGTCVVNRQKELSEDQLHYILLVNIKCEDPLQRAAAVQSVFSVAALPYTKTFSNIKGNYPAPFDKIGIQGRYINSKFTKEVRIQVLSGITIKGEAYLSDQLLMDEWLYLYEDGRMESEYLDDFATNQKVNRNAYAYSNVVFIGGMAIIAANGYLTFLFHGPNQTRDNILLQADLTYTGSPLIQSSDDGLTWNTAVDTADLKNYYFDYYLNETDKRGDVYIRFYCPAGAMLNLNFIRFKAIRDVPIDGEMKILAGSNCNFVFSDGSTSNHLANLDLEFRPRRLP
jgi:hypothetical protein